MVVISVDDYSLASDGAQRGQPFSQILEAARLRLAEDEHLQRIAQLKDAMPFSSEEGRLVERQSREMERLIYAHRRERIESFSAIGAKRQ